MTLIEELQDLSNRYRSSYEELGDKDELVIANTIDDCIDIVKKHSDWVSVSDEIPMLEVEAGFRRFEPNNFYQIIDDENGLHNAYFSTNRYSNDDRALFTLCELDFYNGNWVVDDEYEVVDISKVKYWKPLPLPQPPSEVQSESKNTLHD